MNSVRYALAASAVLLPAQAFAGSVTVTLPRPQVAEYKKPYVAGWIEPAAGPENSNGARTLFIWYAFHKQGGEPGTKWLADLRSWWRKSGRSLHLPADGITGATRGPGSYTIPLPADLKPGSYVVNIETARENGGRELVSVPVTIPNPNGKASGKTELGTVTVAP